jgi:hypothetical protein
MCTAKLHGVEQVANFAASHLPSLLNKNLATDPLLYKRYQCELSPTSRFYRTCHYELCRHRYRLLRAFVQERATIKAARNAIFSPAILYVGYRQHENDFLYCDELAK